MSALFLELARTVLFLSSSPITFRLRRISLIVVIASHGKVAKAIPVARLGTHKLLVTVDAIVGLEILDILARILADKHMVDVLPNFVLVKRWLTLASLVTDSKGVTPVSLLCFVLLCSTSS